MNGVVATIEPVLRRVDPALELNVNRVSSIALCCLAARRIAHGRDENLHLALQYAVFWSPAELHRQLTRWQQNRVTVRAVDLLLKEKVWGQPLRLRRNDVIGTIAK